jgi:hypothetical protein
LTMPQGPIQTFDFIDGSKTSLNINQPTVVKAGAGMLSRISVITAGTGVGTIYDSASTANCTTANAVAPIPDTAGGTTSQLGIPVFSGITVQPGPGQSLVIVYR